MVKKWFLPLSKGFRNAWLHNFLLEFSEITIAAKLQIFVI